MYNFDSLSLKFFTDENLSFLENASVQKIQQPSRYELVLTIRNIAVVKKLYVNINPKYAHICFLKDVFYEIPKQPPMFCMLLRKYLDGAKITAVKHVEYERIFELYFKTYNEIKEEVELCLTMEIMGKHSNIILYNAIDKKIIGCAHNISAEKSSVRELYGGIEYFYPPKQSKKDILKTSFASFVQTTEDAIDEWDLADIINKNYFYLTKYTIEKILNISKDNVSVFENLQNAVFRKEFFYEKVLDSFEGEINPFISNFYFQLLKNDLLKTKSNELKKIIKKELKKNETSLKNSKNDEKAKEYMERGNLILQNIHLISSGDEFLDIQGQKIMLDKTKSASENAQRYFKLYQKAKNSCVIEQERNEKAKENERYLKEILFFVENAKSHNELQEIEEIFIQKENKKTNKKKITAEKIPYENYDIYLGKNALQNDYLISKVAAAEDFWFHLKDCPSCHIILKNNTRCDKPNDDILLFCAKAIKENSPLKNSTKATVIYTKKKYLQKPPVGKKGFVLYKNQKEIVIE